jgi:hypothetical protein
MHGLYEHLVHITPPGQTNPLSLLYTNNIRIYLGVKIRQIFF